MMQYSYVCSVLSFLCCVFALRTAICQSVHIYVGHVHRITMTCCHVVYCIMTFSSVYVCIHVKLLHNTDVNEALKPNRKCQKLQNCLLYNSRVAHLYDTPIRGITHCF